jgi:hypothetical protein
MNRKKAGDWNVKRWYRVFFNLVWDIKAIKDLKYILDIMIERRGREMTMKRHLAIDDQAIRFIAEELMQTYLSEECNHVLNCLLEQDLSLAGLRRASGLSYTVCREALLLLTGATFVTFRNKGMAKLYRLTATGKRLAELLSV